MSSDAIFNASHGTVKTMEAYGHGTGIGITDWIKVVLADSEQSWTQYQLQ